MSGPERRPAAAWIAALGVGLVALGLSLWRLMPGVGFWDTAEFQTVLPVLGTAHPTGYPTYVLLGWLSSIVLTPIGEPALRMNVLSAILVAAGAALSADLARRVSGSLILGAVAGIGVATTSIVWAVGTHADPHALHFTLVAAVLWLLVRWEQRRCGNPMEPDAWPGLENAESVAQESWPVAGATSASTRDHASDGLLIAAAFVTGLSVGNHSLTLLLGPPILLFVVIVEPGILRRARFVTACVMAFLIPTVLVRFELILRAGWFRAPFVYADPSTWDGFWYVTLGAQFHGWVTSPFENLLGRIDDVAAYAVGQFGPLAPVILVALAVSLIRQPRWTLLSGLTMGVTLFFNSVYPDGAIDRYYIVPILIAWTWLAILGATVVDVLTGRGLVPGASALGRPGASRAIRFGGLALVAILLLAPSLLALPSRARDVDRSADRAAQRWTDEVLAALEPNAVVVSWWSYSTPLWYATIVDGRRPDICVIDDRNRLDFNLGELDHVIDRYLDSRPVYLIRNGSSELPDLADRYDIRSVGAPTASNLLRVLPRDAAARTRPVAPDATAGGVASNSLRRLAADLAAAPWVAPVAPREACR